MGAVDEGRTTPARGGDLVARILSAVALAAIALLGTILGAWAAAIVLGIVTAIVHLEWASLTDRSPWPTAVFTGGLVIALAMIALGYPLGGLMIVGLAVLAALATIDIWRPIGVAYAAMLGVGLLVLRLSPEGLAAVLLILVVVWATDTGAFFAGRIIGGAKLWPRVSPNKTWAGAIGGLVAGVIGGFVVADVLHLDLSVPLIGIVVLLSIASQAGDLFESWVKRRFGAKDSGDLIPGHGGLMDRVDGLAFASGLAACIGWFHGGANVAQGLLAW